MQQPIIIEKQPAKPQVLVVNNRVAQQPVRQQSSGCGGTSMAVGALAGAATGISRMQWSLMPLWMMQYISLQLMMR